jgi:hypothetical protein
MGKEYKGKSLVDAGASIAGSITGAAVRILFPDPISGIAAGAIVSETTKRVIGEFASRVLSSREEARIGATISFAAVKIQNRLDAGEVPRTDGFFERDETGRSNADEIFEGVLLKAKNESQEKKIKYLGNLFANVAFRSDISITEANFFLNMAEEISYRQFCFVALLNQEGVLNIESLRRRNHPTGDLQILRREEWMLHAPSFGVYGLIDGNNAWEDWLNELGDKFFELLGLNEIPQEDINGLRQLINLCELSPPPSEDYTADKQPPENKRKRSNS